MVLSDYRLANLPRSTQILIFAVVSIGLAVAFYLYCLKGLIERREALQTEVARLESSVAQGTAIESRLNQFKRELAQLEERLTVLRSILPAEKETPMVLRSVQQMAASSNLKILKFTPRPVVPRVFYVDWPILIEVEGNYDGLGLFFEKISQATRIIDASNISVKGIEGSMNPERTLEAVCTATTFVFKEDEVTAVQK